MDGAARDLEGVAVPVECSKPIRKEAGEIGLRGLRRFFNGVPANLDTGIPCHLRTQYAGKKLGPEADAYDAFFPMERLANETFFPGKPGITVLLVDAHGPAEDDKPVQLLGRRHTLAGIQARGCEAVPPHQGPRLDVPRPLEGDMLQVMD